MARLRRVRVSELYDAVAGIIVMAAKWFVCIALRRKGAKRRNYDEK
jgi:hypothetical protein